MPYYESDDDDADAKLIVSDDELLCDMSEPMPFAGDSDDEVSFDNEDTTPFSVDDLDEPQNLAHDGDERPQKRRRLRLRKGGFIYPLSQYDGFKAPLPVSKERHVISEFTDAMLQRRNSEAHHENARASPASENEVFTEFELTDFSIYLPGTVVRSNFEMRPLNNLSTKSGHSWYCFDGILRSGDMRRYVQCVPFKVCSIGNYGLEHHGVGDNIWIQSAHNEGTDLYYRLKSPSSAYERYHEGFIWLANLAKHFVDYLKAMSDQKLKISIPAFRSGFADWLFKAHGESPDFQVWFQQFGSRNFCAHVASNIDFLWKESVGTWPALSKQPLWKEVMTFETIRPQNVKGDGTVVTPYVYDCFSHLKFGGQLKKVAPRSDVDDRRKLQGRTLNLTTDGVNHQIDSMRAHQESGTEIRKASVRRNLDPKSVNVGDVLGVTMDGINSNWKNEQSKWEAPDDCWYVYVQRVNVTTKGRTFDVIWLYKPSHTSCAVMKYSYQDELFLSNNCWHDMPEDEIIRKASVSWGCLPGESKSQFFIRQTYLTHDNSFVTLKEYHKKCAHVHDDIKTDLQDVVDKYCIGDTVLIVPPSRIKSKHGLEPAEIVAFVQEGRQGSVVVKRLPRRRDLDGNKHSRPNELVYSEQTFTIAAKNVVRKCFIRFYSLSDLENRMIPTPYNRDGTGDAYYILTRLIENTAADDTTVHLEPIEKRIPGSLKQGFDPKAKVARQRLRGLDLFCGGGNFGRGLEEGGAVHNTHAVDLNKIAIHSYFANLEDPQSTKLYYGSVDDMLEQALMGNPSGSALIPLPGQIDFISAGSPCQGFSLLNSRRGSEQGLKNQSLVASVAAYIDVYRPQYALLENVIAMAQKGLRRTEDVLSQLICCLVGMGYQVQLFNLDAWSFGSPQSRSRIFVSITAPGLELPSHPELTHSHPERTRDRGLGKMANNQDYGQRRFGAAPFKFVTAGEATEDLPDIGDGQTYQCTRHPDHRMPIGVPRILRTRIELIPLSPWGMNFIKTWERGKLTAAERAHFPGPTTSGGPRQNVSAGSKAWERIHPHMLFPTIATSSCPACARTGRTLHWNQQRLITVLEARRAQSFPDHEVILGHPKDQWRIVGNSVARSVSLALGLSLREAWLKNTFESGNAPDQVAASTEVQTSVSFTYSDEQEVSSGEVSEKQYGQSLKVLDLVSSASASRDEVTSPTSSMSEAEARIPKDRKRRFNINTKDKHKMTDHQSMGGHLLLKDDEEYSADEMSGTEEPPDMNEIEELHDVIGIEELPGMRRKRGLGSMHGSNSSDSPTIDMKRLEKGKNVPREQLKPSKPRPSAGQQKSVRTDRRPVVLVSPATKKTTEETIIPISDSEDELARNYHNESDDDDDNRHFTRAARETNTYIPVNNDIFAPYELTYNSTMLGNRRRR